MGNEITPLYQQGVEEINELNNQYGISHLLIDDFNSWVNLVESIEKDNNK